MTRRLLLSLLFLLVFASGKSFAQVSCPPNIDFEFGNLSNWNFFRGTVSYGPFYTVTPCPPAFTLHTLMAGTGTDAYGGFPIVDPSGGSYALRLGKDSNWYNTDRAQYFVRVPAGSTHYSLIYRFAVVLELPLPVTSHTTEQQPSFVAIAYDSATGIQVPCAQDTFYGNSPTSGLLSSPVTSAIAGNGFDVKYKSWSTISVNLSGMGGRTVAVEFTAAGCTASGHFGYGYVDMTCGLFAIESKICDDKIATLTGPPGFEQYSWFDSLTFTKDYGHTQVITTPMPDTAITFAVIVEPFIGFGCPDTLYTHISPSFLQMHASNDTLVCANTPVMLHSYATDSTSALPLSYNWAPALGLTCTTCDNPIATPLSTTVYTVTVINKSGCEKKDQVVVTLDKVTTLITKVDDSCYGFNNGNATVTPVTGIAPFSYVWTTMPLQTARKAINLPGGVYSVTATDNLGCKGLSTVRIAEPPPNNLTITGVAGPTRCLGSDGYIALSGLKADSTYTFSYTLDGIPTTQTRKASDLGKDTLKNLTAGLYENITVVVALLARPHCPFNIVGPITLIDPPTPPLPAVGSNGPLCKGDTLKLATSNAVPGVVFYWAGPAGFTWNKQDTAVAKVDFLQAGTYTVTATINGCTAQNTTNVIIKPFPQPVAIGDTACSGGDIQLRSFSSNGATSYRWSGPDAFSSADKDPLLKKVNMAAAGTYTVIATLDGCSQSATTGIILVKTPVGPMVTDTTYCQYDNPVAPLYTINGTNVTWYAADGNIFPGIPTPSTAAAGVTVWYADQRISGPGADPVVCVSLRIVDTVTIVAKREPVLSVTDTVICVGSIITFNVSNTGDDASGICWCKGGGDSVKNVNPLRQAFDNIGDYTITVTPMHTYCPNSALTQRVHVAAYPVLDLGPDTAICIGGKSITLADKINAGNKSARWLWNTDETGSNILVTKPGIYFARVNIKGCPIADTVIVKNDCYIDVPNAFTPNGDGVNDFWLPRQFLSRGLTAFKMEVFNRWGQMIFISKNIAGLGWDGNFNSTPQPEGVYVYRLEVTFKDGQVENHTGNITLIR